MALRDSTAVCSNFRPLTHRYYKLSVLLMCFFVPISVPCYLWGESLWVAYFIPALLRYTLVLNATWLVNSAAHMWGNRPYDQTINPRENKFVTFSAIGMRTQPLLLVVARDCFFFTVASLATADSYWIINIFKRGSRNVSPLVSSTTLASSIVDHHFTHVTPPEMTAGAAVAAAS